MFDTSPLVIPGITDPATLACLARARKYKQYCDMVENTLQGICPFCHLNVERDKIVDHNETFIAKHCIPSEAHTKHHFLLIPRRHIKGTQELNCREREDLWNLMDKVKSDHNIPSCGILIRDGDATLSAGTIQHLHIHIMVPDGSGRVESPFYKGKDAEAESLARAKVFEKLRQGEKHDDLRAEEKELVNGRL